MAFVVSCEHGGRHIPQAFQHCFQSHAARHALAGRLAFDPGAATAARTLAELLGAPLTLCKVSRLLVDVDRSVRHRNLYSKYGEALTAAERSTLLRDVHERYRQQVQQAVEYQIEQHGFVIHLSVHTFASKRKEQPRRTDIGLLYDPAREEERELCCDWADELWETMPAVRIRRNYPSRGTADSIVKWLRTLYSDDQYIGIGLHLNQNWAARSLPIADEVLAELAEALMEITYVDPTPSESADASSEKTENDVAYSSPAVPFVKNPTEAEPVKIVSPRPTSIQVDGVVPSKMHTNAFSAHENEMTSDLGVSGLPNEKPIRYPRPAS